MENFFSSFMGVSVTFDDMQVVDGMGVVNVLISRFDGKKFSYIVTRLPELDVLDSAGFSEDEKSAWLEHVRKSQSLIWKEAKEKLVNWLA